MVKWIAQLSNGEMAVEGVEPWGEIAGERLPWPRLCAFLAENNLYIDNLGLIKDNGGYVTFPEDSVCWSSKDKQFNSCFIQYDMELDNIFAGGSAKTIIHIGFTFDDYVDHLYVDTETGEVVASNRTDDYKPLCSSPKR